MKCINVFVEGQTEEAFIKDVVAPSLYHLNIFLYPRLLSTSKKGKGGAITYDRLHFHARNALRQNPTWFLTTFFDLYALDNTFPEFNSIQSLNSPLDKANHLETALHNQILNEFNIQPSQFFPHIQPYEYEGLLFSDVNQFGQVEPEWQRYQNQLMQIRNNFDTPEHINNSYQTAPSKRLEALLDPKYRKTRHGPLLAKKISLAIIENECEHFRQWLDRLRNV
ncbi:DUF4276 family protein [Otariodibacter sp.]|uniref:DUF4276 family protein n=1 Tax=Otariodibacter sp. TaxID=3030919 RepID=UPI0026210488|nr:DUF4276 family protein [Otariodibacter sp.]